MMSGITLPLSFWSYALLTAVLILNKAPTKKVDKTPYETWHGKAPCLSFLRVWGCEAYVRHDALSKLDPKSTKYIFVGYHKDSIGYLFYNPTENNIFVSRRAEFLESKFLFEKTSGRHVDLEEDFETLHHYKMTLLFNKRLLSLSNLLFRIVKKHPAFANLIVSVMNLTDMDMSLTDVTCWILINGLKP